MSDDILTEVKDGVLVITINRPDAKNAMNKAGAEGIAAALDRLDAEDDLRVAILTGAGGTFCSGMDLKGFQADHRRCRRLCAGRRARTDDLVRHGGRP